MDLGAWNLLKAEQEEDGAGHGGTHWESQHLGGRSIQNSDLKASPVYIRNFRPARKREIEKARTKLSLLGRLSSS